MKELVEGIPLKLLCNKCNGGLDRLALASELRIVARHRRTQFGSGWGIKSAEVRPVNVSNTSAEA